MATKNIETKVNDLLKPIIQNLGYDLYDVIYEKEGKDYYLRIIIDSERGIDLNDCEKVNDVINDILDEADYIKEQYFLEVSSPGIERILRKKEQFEKQIGNKISVKLFKSIENLKELQGTLVNINEEEIVIEIEEQGVKNKENNKRNKNSKKIKNNKEFNDNKEIENNKNEEQIISIAIKNIALAKTVYDW